jgi:hypothetical protein
MEQEEVIQVANQGGYQPAIVTTLAPILEEGDTFMSGENHIDFPKQLLSIPKDCVGIVEKSVFDTSAGSVSVLFKDTITARRLIRNAVINDPVTKPEITSYSVLVNEDFLNRYHDTAVKSLQWEPKITYTGSRWPNKVVTYFEDQNEAAKLYLLLRHDKDSGAMKSWI